MIFALLSFILSTTLLYLSSRLLIKRFLSIFSLLTKSTQSSVNLLFFFFLPGIFLHEFSHILSAELLRVQTGHLSLKPQLKNNQLKLGSAQIAATDPIRLTLIGTAPFITGTLALWLLLTFGLNLNLAQLSLSSFPVIFHQPTWLLILSFYLLFAISNTMFSSPSDLQAAGLPIILLLIFLGTLKLLNLNLPPTTIPYFTNFFYSLTTLFILVLLLNLSLLLIFQLARRLLSSRLSPSQ